MATSFTGTCGANIAFGACVISVYIPYDECKDLSCADVIRRLLRWVPDTVCYIDYQQTIPTIYFKRRAQLTSTVLSLNSENISEFSIQPRYDLQMNSVVLKFERTNSTNGKAWKTTSVQKYPTNASENSLKSLVLTIDLEGAKSNYITQAVSVVAIETSSIAWWKAHIPALNGIAASNI